MSNDNNNGSNCNSDIVTCNEQYLYFCNLVPRVFPYVVALGTRLVFLNYSSSLGKYY